MSLRALEVIEIFKFLQAISPTGRIFVSWVHEERANEPPIFDTFLAVRHLKYSAISKIITHNLFGNNNVCEFSTYCNNSFLHDVLCLRHTPYFSRLPSLKVLVKKSGFNIFGKVFENEFLKNMEIYQKKTN